MNICVVGGGASGMIAAIAAAKNGANVYILEKNDRVGKKILSTGNGKCNLTNLDFSIDKYNSTNNKKLAKFFDLFNEKSTISFFGECGLMLKNKSGYIYPSCEQASVVLDVLRHMLDVFAIKVITDAGVTNIRKEGSSFVIKADKEYIADRVIIACGSLASLGKKELSTSGITGFELAKRFGHNIVDVLPALVQVECYEDFFSQIAGVRADACITLYDENNAIARESGELQLTNYGISGIPVFQLSGLISRELNDKKKLYAVIDFMQELDEEAFSEFIRARISSFKGESIESYFLGMLNKKICSLIMKLNGLKPTDTVREEIYDELFKVSVMMKQFVVSIKSPKGIENAQVCTGGVSLDEVDDTLMSNMVEGLYLCGEMLDVDGKCGGYNLQWAWTSGFIAGSYASVKK